MRFAPGNQRGVTTSPAASELILALQKPSLYDHPVETFGVIETHISWVILTGQFAYKIKKPVDFGFVDFSTLEKRHYYCAEELRLNRRFAPDLYLEVISITGSPTCPQFGGTGNAIEYAVKMKQFPQQGLVSRLAIEHRLERVHIDSIAEAVSNFHLKIDKPGPLQTIDSANANLKWNDENLSTLTATLPAGVLPDYFAPLKNWCVDSARENLPVMLKRQQDGFVRECHGDLHLGNIALIDGQITLFDCIEFNPELRWIDTMSEIAFVGMDLIAAGYRAFAWRFVNRYLAATGDYHGMALFRYYFVYRALVRAKVAALGLSQKIYSKQESYREPVRYLELARSWTDYFQPALIVMHGLSGSGKSTVASKLVELIGAIQVRSDLERKRLAGMEPDGDSASAPGLGIYTNDATIQTYDQLARLASNLLQAGFSVIVDASFLEIRYRNQFKRLAFEHRAPHIVVSCKAPEQELRERITQRRIARNDPSEASLEVLNRQLQTQDILSEQELLDTYTIICLQSELNAAQLRGLKQQIEIPQTG